MDKVSLDLVPKKEGEKEKRKMRGEKGIGRKRDGKVDQKHVAFISKEEERETTFHGNE